MIFYFILFLFIAFAMVFADKIEDEKKKKALIFILISGLTIISGTRFELGGSDYYIYRGGFDAVPDLWHISEMQSSIQGMKLVNLFEPGFLFFCSLVKTFGFNFYGFTLIESAIWYICMYKGLKRYAGDWTIVLLVFLYKLFFYNTFISLRQSLTIALFFLALEYLQDKKPVHYYIVCCIALTFHNGALLMFLLYPLLQFQLSKKRLVIMNVICWTFYFLEKAGLSIFSLVNWGLTFINSESPLIIKAKAWLSFDYGLNIFHVLEYMALMLLVLMFYEKIIDTDKNAEFMIKIFLCLLPIFAIFSGNVVSTRFKDYFTITYGVILTYLCQIDKGRLKWMIKTGTLCICAYGYFRYLNNFDEGGLLPYVSYIEKGIGIFYPK